MENEKDINFDITKKPMVCVTWLDARDMETGWLPVKDILDAPLAVCQEVGWMVVNNSVKVVIMRSWCTDKDDNHGGGVIAIPKKWVKSIVYLKPDYAIHEPDSHD